MKYLQPSFTLPTAPPRISEEDYEIAVGLRCPKCRDRWIGADTGYRPICGCVSPIRMTNIQSPEPYACIHDPAAQLESCPVPGCSRYKVPEALKPLMTDLKFDAITRRKKHQQ